MAIEIKIDNKTQIPQRLEHLANRITAMWNGDQPIVVTFYSWVDFSSRAQKRLYWKWVDQLWLAFDSTKDDMHDMLRYRFLGTETVTIAGVETIRLPSTKTMKKDRMSEYMGQVEAWATSMGERLPIPADNEYAKYREAAQ